MHRLHALHSWLWALWYDQVAHYLLALTLASAGGCRGSDDTVCTECSFGLFQDEIGSDKTCQVQPECPTGLWLSDPGTASVRRNCTECTVCPPGNFVFERCSTVLDTACFFCDFGKFSDVENATECKPATVCQPGQYTTVPYSSTADRECKACTLGVDYQPFENVNNCFALSPECDVGTFQSNQLSTIEDRLCESCAQGKYQDERGLPDCKTPSTCPAGQYVLRSSSSTSDRQCASW